ncbi:MAG: hypothetical protein ACE5FU_07755, partial [Nitrospinota bacterium]
SLCLCIDIWVPGNLDIPAIQAFPDITGTYTVKMKRSQMDNFQKGEDDAIVGDNDGGWEESYYVKVYEGNLKDKGTYKEIPNTPSKRMAVWMEKGKRDGCYEVNSNSDAISTYSMQASATPAPGDVLTISSSTTSNDIYDFLTAHNWLPEALTEDAANAATGSADQSLQNLDCVGLMPLLKPFYAEATVDADSGYCTALISGAAGVQLPEVQTYLATLPAQEATGAAEMLSNMLFAENQGPPHAEWCKEYQVVKGNTTKTAEFVNFMVGMCEMHTKGDESLFVKRDIVRQFFDIFAEIKREPRSDKKMDALADFIKDNDITAANFAVKMGDSDADGILDADQTLLTSFLNIMSGMPCFDDGCKSWKRALKLAADNITAFGDNTLCQNFNYTQDDFCFTYAEFTATSTTIDLEITDDGTTPTLSLRTKTNGTWGSSSAPTNVSISENIFTMFDPTGAQQQVTEARYSFDYNGNSYNLGVDGGNDREIFGEMINGSGQYLGVFGNKVSKEVPAPGTTVTVYRIKSGGGMAEQIGELACSGGYHPVEIKTAGPEVTALMAINLPPFDFASNDENAFNTNLASEQVGDWYQALYNLYAGTGQVAEGCGKNQLKHSVQGIYWALQAPGVPAIVADPDEPTVDEIADVVLILNNLTAGTPPAGLTASLTNAEWVQIQNNLVQQRQLMNIYWNIQSIQQEVGYSQMKALLANADMDTSTPGVIDNLEDLTAGQMATFLATFANLDFQGHWSWIWGNEQASQQASGHQDACHRPDYVAAGECIVWTAETLEATNDRGEENLQDIKHRLRDARRKFALEEDSTFRTNVNNIIAHSKCIPDITFKDEPEIVQTQAGPEIKFLLNLRGPAFRLLDDAINFKKDSTNTTKYSVSDVSMEIHQQDMTNTCVFGEKKEISNIPLPTLNSDTKYEFTGLFMRAFFDGCGASDNLQNSEESSNTEQSSSNTGSSTVGSERFREVQAFKATQD